MGPNSIGQVNCLFELASSYRTTFWAERMTDAWSNFILSDLVETQSAIVNNLEGTAELPS